MPAGLEMNWVFRKWFEEYHRIKNIQEIDAAYFNTGIILPEKLLVTYLRSCLIDLSLSYTKMYFQLHS